MLNMKKDPYKLITLFFGSSYFSLCVYVELTKSSELLTPLISTVKNTVIVLGYRQFKFK